MKLKSALIDIDDTNYPTRYGFYDAQQMCSFSLGIKTLVNMHCIKYFKPNTVDSLEKIKDIIKYLETDS